MKNATLKFLINGSVWIVVLGFVVSCVIGAVLEFFVKILFLNTLFNTPVHKRVAFLYNTVHNRCIRALVGSMVGLAFLYNRTFGEKYLVQFQLAVVDSKGNNSVQPKGVVIPDFRFMIAKHPARQNRPWNYKRPWQLSKEMHDVSYFILDWKSKYHISLEIKVYKWKMLSWSKRWLYLYISPRGVLSQNYLSNARVWFYTKDQKLRQFRWIVKLPGVVSSLFTSQHYDVAHIGSYIVNGMSRRGHFNAAYDIEYASLESSSNSPNKPFCVFCPIIGKEEGHPPKIALKRKLVYTIPTLQYIRWCIFCLLYTSPSPRD